MHVNFVIFLYALVLAQIAQALALYVGCFNHPFAFENAVGEYVYLDEQPPYPDCGCRNLGYDYSYTYQGWVEPSLPFEQSCFCTSTPPPFRFYYDECQAYIQNIPDVRVNLDSPSSDGWSFAHCYQPTTPINGISITTLPQCLDHCKSQGLLYAAVIHPRDGSPVSCGCYANQAVWQSSPIGACEFDYWNIYHYGLQPSSLAHKRRNGQSQHTQALCPAGTAACNLASGTEAGYECIDTFNELESCGGCTFGNFGVHDETTDSGINCVTQPGVSTNGVVCSEGRCIISKCEEGYVMVEDKCVAEHA